MQEQNINNKTSEIHIVGELALHRGAVEGQQQFLVHVILPQEPEEVQQLLHLISGDMIALKPEGGDRFYSFSIYNERAVSLSVPPEVHDVLFCFKAVQLLVYLL